MSICFIVPNISICCTNKLMRIISSNTRSIMFMIYISFTIPSIFFSRSNKIMICICNYIYCFMIMCNSSPVVRNINRFISGSIINYRTIISINSKSIVRMNFISFIIPNTFFIIGNKPMRSIFLNINSIMSMLSGSRSTSIYKYFFRLTTIINYSVYTTTNS